ncbi:hypothetical protein K438DRAFT_1786217 [Mycena galopus ATCC 62051]|nr:hypothetical protein K438DRAFT_1786217 [Mycena galopus ATCC 62051]
MVPPSEDDDILGSPVPATARNTRRSKQKPEVSEPELSDVPPAKKPKGKPGPKPKKKPTPEKAQDSNDDAEVPSDPKPPVKKPKHVNYGLEKKGTMVECDDDENEIKAVGDIVCIIPGVAMEGNQHVPLPSSHSFEDALEVIYETIGCPKKFGNLATSPSS